MNILVNPFCSFMYVVRHLYLTLWICSLVYAYNDKLALSLRVEWFLVIEERPKIEWWWQLTLVIDWCWVWSWGERTRETGEKCWLKIGRSIIAPEVILWFKRQILTYFDSSVVRIGCFLRRRVPIFKQWIITLRDYIYRDCWTLSY